MQHAQQSRRDVADSYASRYTGRRLCKRDESDARVFYAETNRSSQALTIATISLSLATALSVPPGSSAFSVIVIRARRSRASPSRHTRITSTAERSFSTALRSPQATAIHVTSSSPDRQERGSSSRIMLDGSMPRWSRRSCSHSWYWRIASPVLPSARWTRITARCALSRSGSPATLRSPASSASDLRPARMSNSHNRSSARRRSCRKRSCSNRTQSSYQSGSRSPVRRESTTSPSTTASSRSTTCAKDSLSRRSNATSSPSRRKPLATSISRGSMRWIRQSAERRFAAARSSKLSSQSDPATCARRSGWSCSATNATTRCAPNGSDAGPSSPIRRNPSSRCNRTGRASSRPAGRTGRSSERDSVKTRLLLRAKRFQATLEEAPWTCQMSHARPSSERARVDRTSRRREVSHRRRPDLGQPARASRRCAICARARVTLGSDGHAEVTSSVWLAGDGAMIVATPGHVEVGLRWRIDFRQASGDHRGTPDQGQR